MIAYAHEPSCPSCGRETSDPDARFCGGCGSALPTAAASPVILSAVDELDPQDARTRIGVARADVGRSTISPGASLHAVGQSTRTRRSRRVGRPTAATHGGERPSSYAAPRPVPPPRGEPDLDLAASRGHESPAPEPEPSPAAPHFDGDPFFEDVFQGDATPETRDDEPRPSRPSRRPQEVPHDGGAELDELDVAAIQRARRRRAFIGVGATLAAIGAAVFLAI